MIQLETYKPNLHYYMDNYSLNFGVNNVERLTAIILLCNITQLMRKTTPEVLVAEVINKIIKDDTTATNEFWTKTSYICEGLLQGESIPFPDYGFKELKEKANKIREINENVLPF